jgi:hypothetical protein
VSIEQMDRIQAAKKEEAKKGAQIMDSLERSTEMAAARREENLRARSQQTANRVSNDPLSLCTSHSSATQ